MFHNLSTKYETIKKTNNFNELQRVPRLSLSLSFRLSSRHFLPVASLSFKIYFSTEINLKKMLMFKVDILNFVNVILTICMNICISFSLHPAMIEINYARFPQASGATERAFMY